MPPLPVTLLTGFLGAGKTTLLNALLPRPGLRRAAVVINEFGDIGIDHLLVDEVAGDLLMLTTGCICCAARGDLLDALHNLLDRRSAGRIEFDRILIETTGLADPGPILDAILLDPALRPACRLDGVVTVIDVLDGAAILGTHEEARRQAASADVIVLSKADLDRGGTDRRAALEAMLGALNPAAAIVDGRDRDAVADAVMAPNRAAAATLQSSHRHHHRHAEITTVSLEAGCVDPVRFDAFMVRLLRRLGATLLRVKGIVASSADPSRPVVVHAVGSRLYPSERLAAWPSEDRRTRLVVIARGGVPADIQDLWSAYFGPPAIDRADADGLAAWADLGPGLF